MYKLVAIAGKIRGDEFVLEDGDNSLGRDEENNICIPIQGVSKRHMNITVKDDSCYLEDLGSSNGTFLNGKVVNRATLENGDKITLPDCILQVVYVQEKKVIIKQRAEGSDVDVEEYKTGGTPPGPLPQKIIWFFKYKVMPIFHGLNEEYEWHYMFGIFIAIFSVLAISLTIFPVLEDSKKILLIETAKRGGHYADQVARINNRALEQKRLDKVDTNFIKSEDGVRDFRLFDLEGRIVRPIEKLNDYVMDPFFVTALNWAKANKESRQVKAVPLSDGQIGIAKQIFAFNPKMGIEESVGVIAIRFEPTSLKVEAAKSRKAYLESLATTALVAIFFFGFVYYLTIRPIEEMRYQLEEALRGTRKNLEGTYLMSELKPLRNSINTILQRMRELSNEGDEDMEEEESDIEYVRSFYEIMQTVNGPAMVLDSMKNVSHLNMVAEDLVGFRESASQGMSLLDVSREKGFAATVIELCDNSASADGACQKGEYELGGIPHTVSVVTLMGRDSFAKSYLITFAQEE
jgi:pSer/pThr/pTyr-binding forkhead associated (FHA) protein